MLKGHCSLLVGFGLSLQPIVTSDQLKLRLFCCLIHVLYVLCHYIGFGCSGMFLMGLHLCVDVVYFDECFQASVSVSGLYIGISNSLVYGVSWLSQNTACVDEALC